MSEKVLYLMQGVPGSGKSTIARMIQMYHNENSLDVAVTISTDTYRLAPRFVCHAHGTVTNGTNVCDECGDGDLVRRTDVYTFDPAENAKFHKMTQRDCALLMQREQPVIIVDNTNIAEWQAHPYLVLADIYGYTVQVVSVDCGLANAIERQNEPDRLGKGDRAVPAETVTAMYDGMERLLASPRYRPAPE